MQILNVDVFQRGAFMSISGVEDGWVVHAE